MPTAKLAPYQLTKPAIQEMFERFREQNPEPTTELNYTNDFTLLVAVVLSAQMTDTGVNRATDALFKIADTPAKIIALGDVKLGEYLKTINFHGTKTKNVMALSNILVEKHGGQVPRTHDELVALPGVGNKTANVVMNTAFGAERIAVDTHILRVSNRTGLAHGTTPEQVEDGLMKVVPKDFLRNAHHWLLLHGRYICVARKPRCPDCLIRDICKYPDKTEITEMPKARRST
jgi:endonuclease-3